MLTVGGFGMVSVFSFLVEWLEYLRWGGAAYLVWLGAQQWREKAVDLNEAKLHAGPKKSLFWQGFLVSVTNPKTIFFYAAFFPQFMNMNADATSQMALLSVTFLIIATFLDCGFALLSGKLRQVFKWRASWKNPQQNNWTYFSQHRFSNGSVLEIITFKLINLVHLLLPNFDKLLSWRRWVDRSHGPAPLLIFSFWQNAQSVLAQSHL